jgi:hypothetical protein
MSCSSVTKEDKYGKHGKKSGENGKTKGRKNKVNDSKPDGNHEVDLTAGSDLEMDSRILSALLTVCGFCRSLYLFILFWYGNLFYYCHNTCLYYCLHLIVLILCMTHALNSFHIFSYYMQGVNRALPYVASAEVDDIIEVQAPILFRLVSFFLWLLKIISAMFVLLGNTVFSNYHFGFM